MPLYYRRRRRRRGNGWCLPAQVAWPEVPFHCRRRALTGDLPATCPVPRRTRCFCRLHRVHHAVIWTFIDVNDAVAASTTLEILVRWRFKASVGSFLAPRDWSVPVFRSCSMPTVDVQTPCQHFRLPVGGIAVCALVVVRRGYATASPFPPTCGYTNRTLLQSAVVDYALGDLSRPAGSKGHEAW